MFVNKLSDADGELAETVTWLDFSFDCGYISAESHNSLYSRYKSVGSMLGTMIQNPERFVPRSKDD